MEKKNKKVVEAVSLDSVKGVGEEKNKKNGYITQEDIDELMTKYELDDESADDLLNYISENNIEIKDDSLDDIEADSIDLSDLGDLGDLDLDLDLDLGEDLDGLGLDDDQNLEFVDDFDMYTGDTFTMYRSDDNDANQLGSNVKINDPVKMYLKEIGTV